MTILGHFRLFTKSSYLAHSHNTVAGLGLHSLPYGGGREVSVTRALFSIVSRVQTGSSSSPTPSTSPSSHPSVGKPKLLDQLREALRSRHYSHRLHTTRLTPRPRGVSCSSSESSPRRSLYFTAERVKRNDGSDASRRAIGAADCHPLSVWRFAPVHQAAAAGSRPREQARVYVSR
jgi:hypothetical protein